MSGIFFHEYHYDWLWAPIRMVLLLIVAVSILSTRFRLRPAAVSICWAALMLYFASGVYLASICVTRTWSGVDQLRNYTRYKAQRLDPAVTPLVARATVAGDDAFCELAAVAEDQWVLSGEAVPRSFAVDNEQWESRAALNAYLVGIDRAKFEKAARVAADLWFWENPKREGEVTAAFMRKYRRGGSGPGPIYRGIRRALRCAGGRGTANGRSSYRPSSRGLDDAPAGTVLANLGARKLRLLNSLRRRWPKLSAKLPVRRTRHCFCSFSHLSRLAVLATELRRLSAAKKQTADRTAV